MGKIVVEYFVNRRKGVPQVKCLKCGRETDQTFCEKCRAEMKKYPVKPGTIVLLPKERPGRKAPSRHQATPPEETLRGQRRTIRRLSRAVAVLLVLLVLAGIAIVQLVERSAKPAVGQNYSAVTKPSEESTLPSEAQEAAQSLDTLAEEAVIAPAELEDYLFIQEESEEAAQRQSEFEEETAPEE